MRGISIFLSAVVLLFGDLVWARSLTVEGYARETLPGSTMSAAYLIFRNDGDRALRLQEVRLPGRDGASAALHTTTDVDGISRMRPLKSLAIPAGVEVRMSPGGTHLMLSGLTLRAGERLRLQLHFAGGSVRDVEVPVRALAVAEEHHHH